MASCKLVEGSPATHSDLHGSHDLASIDTEGGETENAVAANFYQRLQKAACL